MAKIIKTNSKLFGTVVVIAIVALTVFCFFGGIEHIEDTNGADNFKLNTITKQDVIECKMGSKGFTSSGITLDDTVKFRSKKFSGVYEVLYTNYLIKSDVDIDIFDFTVKSGNCMFYLVCEDEIVATFEPNGDVFEHTISAKDVKGEIRLILAGESANFSYRLSEYQYEEEFYHS